MALNKVEPNINTYDNPLTNTDFSLTKATYQYITERKDLTLEDKKSVILKLYGESGS